MFSLFKMLLSLIAIIRYLKTNDEIILKKQVNTKFIFTVEDEEYNKQAEENYKKHIEELSKTKVCCSECGKELNLEEKIDLENICIKCLKTYY